MEKEKQLAIDELNNTDYSLVVVKDSEVKYRSKKESVGSIVHLLETKPQLLKDSVVADKIIGRAVAMICDFAEVKFCYGQIVSEGAIDIFEKNDVSYQIVNKVKAIENKDKTDLCPIEKLTLEVEDSLKGIKRIKKFLNKQ